MIPKTLRYLLMQCVVVLAIASLSLSAGREPDDEPDMPEETTNGETAGAIGEQAVTDATRNWPTESRNAAMAMVQKYGEPDVVSDEHLMWMNKGDFHEISVYREQIEHNFPTKHMDVVEHKVYMKVPADKVDELSQFDGSMTVNRTRGTVASFCDSEQSNIAALNLAADIVNNRRSVQEARQMLASLVGTTGASGTMGGVGGGGDYVEALRFDTENQNTARDPGQPLTGGATGMGTGTTGMGTGGTGMGTGTRTGTGTGTMDTLGRDTGLGTGTGTGTGMGTGTGRGTTRDTSDTGRIGTGTGTGTGTTGRTGTGTTTRDTVDTADTADTLRFDTLDTDTGGTGTGTGDGGIGDDE